MFKGAYTLSKAMNDNDAGRPGDALVEHAERDIAELGTGRVRSPAQLPAGLRLPAAVAERRRLRQHPEGHRAGLADQRHVCRVLRHAVPRHRQRHVAEHAAEPADGRSRRHVQRAWQCGAKRHLVRYDGVCPADHASASATSRAISSTVRAGRTSTSRCSVRSRWVARAGSKRESRRTISSTGWCYANPQNNITSGTFGQITGIAGDAALTNAAYRERQMSARTAVQFLSEASQVRSGRSEEVRLNFLDLPVHSAFRSDFDLPDLPDLPVRLCAAATSALPAPRIRLVSAGARDRSSNRAHAAAAPTRLSRCRGRLGRALHAWEQWGAAHEAYARAAAIAPRAFEWRYLDAVVLQRLARHADAVGAAARGADACRPTICRARQARGGAARVRGAR